MLTGTIKLRALAEAAGVDPTAIWRWSKAGLVHGKQRGVGRGNGLHLSREQAIEALAVAVLRRTGVPMQRIAPVVRELYGKGKRGAKLLALGVAGRTVLVDGAGDSVPLRDKRGQYFLPLFLDLRRTRGDIEKIVDELLKQEQEKRVELTRRIGSRTSGRKTRPGPPA